LLISFYLAFIAGVLFWFRRLGFPASKTGQLAGLTLLLTLPEVYVGFQSRQPAIWVWFFIAACFYLMQRGDSTSDVLAGFVLAWSTIKPQNSILVVLYIVLVVYVLERGFRKSFWFLLGFLGTGLALLGITWLILPGWVLDFLNAARDYRGYAGNTGIESVLGANSPAALVVSGIGVLLWVAMIWYTHKPTTLPDRHALMIAYALALQVLIFPTHLYNFIFVIPLLLLTLKWVWEKRAVRWNGVTLVVLILLFLTLYFAYLYWLGILSEGFGGTIGNLMSTIRRWLPGSVYHFTITAILLGPALLWATLREQRAEQTV